MKKLLNLILLSTLVVQGATASPSRFQDTVTAGTAKIGASTSPDSKAVLDVESTTKGVLLPRMTTTQRDAIVSPSQGLEIYNTTTSKKNLYNGSAWKEVVESGSITNADVASGAAITRNKIATGTANHVIINDGTGALSSEAQLSPSRGGTGVSNSGLLTWGSNNLSFTLGANTSLNLPSSGTIATLAGSEILTNKDFDGGTASNSSRFTLPKDTLTNLTSLTRKAGTLVYATDQQKPYFDNGTALTAVGSGGGGSGGGSGFNIIGLNSSWALTTQDDRDAEQSIGNWLAYSDAGGVAPVDMVGGSPNTTCQRTTTAGEVINGAASFKMTVSSGATRQGEGCASSTYVPIAYRGKTLIFSFPFTATGTITDGDFVPYVYDITNSKAVGSSFIYQKILGTQGVMIASFPIDTNTAQIRYGIHIARATNTNAVTLIYDDNSFSYTQAVSGKIGSSTTSYSLTIGATTTAPTTGTISVNNANYSYDGDKIEINYQFYQTSGGTAGSGTYLFSLPPGVSADTTKLVPDPSGNHAEVGHGTIIGTNGFQAYASVHLYDSTHLIMNYIAGSSSAYGSGATLLGSANFNLSTALHISFWAKLPVSNSSANITLGQSAVTRFSSILANGSNVTTTPTVRGQYRTRYRSSAGSNALTDTTPTTLPSSANGMLIYGNAAGNAGGTSGQPSVYDIFVGKGYKQGQVKVDWYSGTGFTGAIDVTFVTNQSSFTQGATVTYDQSTGILTVDAAKIGSGSETSRSLGVSAGAGTYGAFSSGYFEATVFEDARGVGIQAPRSWVTFDTPSGHGSTNTMIRNFTNVSNTGTALVGAVSATLGASVTVLEDGLYSASYTDQQTSGGGVMGISINSTQLTTSIHLISKANRLAVGNVISGATAHTETTPVFFAAAGSVIRPHDDGSLNLSTDLGSFKVTKVSN